MNDRKPVVWITHDKGGYNFDKAKPYGELRVVFKGEFNPFDLHGARLQAVEALKDSAPSDWIVNVGNGLAQTIVALEFARRHNRYPVLVYHTNRLEYVKRELEGPLDEVR